MSYEQIRKAAGLSREKAAARADVTSTTCRLFELCGADAIKDERKRESLVRTYEALERQAAPGPERAA